MTRLMPGGYCARCFGPRRRRAIVVVEFALEGTVYQAGLCNDHAGQFDRELYGWIAVAKEVATDNPLPAPTTAPNRPRVRPVRWPVLHRDPDKTLLVPEEDEQEPATASSPLEVGERSFRLTQHCLNRMGQREVSRGQLADAIEAAFRGGDATVHPSATNPRAKVIHYRSLRVAVTDDGAILTVARRG